MKGQESQPEPATIPLGIRARHCWKLSFSGWGKWPDPNVLKEKRCWMRARGTSPGFSWRLSPCSWSVISSDLWCFWALLQATQGGVRSPSFKVWTLPPVCPSTSLRDGGHSPELPVEVGEQLVATGDGDRLGDKAGSGTGILVAQAQGQEAAEVSIEPTRRAVTDPAESNAQ